MKSPYLLHHPTHLPKNMRNNLQTEKNTKLKFKEPKTEQTVTTKWYFLIHLYKLENDPFAKLTKLNYAALYQNNFEKHRASLTTNVFNEEIVAVLGSNDKKDDAVFFSAVAQILVHDLA